MEGEFEQALGSALRYIAKRDRFEAEVRRHLGSFPDDVQSAVIGRLRGKGIIDDHRAVSAYAASHEGKRAVAVGALRDQLLERGASEEAVEELSLGRTDLERALIVLQSRFRPDPSDRARAGRLLGRRGFEEEDIASALERFFGSGAPVHGES